MKSKVINVPIDGQWRIIKKFAWFPTLVANDSKGKTSRSIWLEWYYITNRYSNNHWSKFAHSRHKWINKEVALAWLESTHNSIYEKYVPDIVAQFYLMEK